MGHNCQFDRCVPCYDKGFDDGYDYGMKQAIARTDAYRNLASRRTDGKEVAAIFNLLVKELTKLNETTVNLVIPKNMKIGLINPSPPIAGRGSEG